MLGQGSVNVKATVENPRGIAKKLFQMESVKDSQSVLLGQCEGALTLPGTQGTPLRGDSFS